MAQEQLLADFSGGMNALAAVDKLDPKECLLAENVRLDETGNIQSAGAFTHQNTNGYSAAGGTNSSNIHSLYWNPSLGGVAGVGQDVFQGGALGTLTSALAGGNVSQQKMSFASAPNRVYFDVGSVGYWSDLNNLLTVDWPSPAVNSSGGAIVTGPNIAGTGTTAGTSTLTWASPNNITSTTTANVASVGIGSPTYISNQLQAKNFGFTVGAPAIQGMALTFQFLDLTVLGTSTATVTMLKGGVPIGTPKTVVYDGVGGNWKTISLGGATDLWGATWVAADINSASYGFQVVAKGSPHTGTTTLNAYGGKITVYQSDATLGFGAGTGAAGTLTGTYSWKITFVAANGEESDAGNASTSVVLSAQQGTLTAIGTGDARTVSRNVYRKGGALTSYYLVGSVADNSSSTYSDNQTDLATLAAGVILAGDVPGDFPNTRLGNVQVRFPVLHYDRIFWVNQKQPNQIIWSKPLNGFAYPAVNFINVGDSKPISRIISIFGELIIIKTDSIWRLTGTDETSFDLTQTPSSVGTDQSFSIAPLPDKILFANRWGLWVFNGYTSQPLTTKLDLWFKQNDRSNKSLFGVNGFHPPEVASNTVPLNFDAVGNSEKFYFAYAEAGKAQNNALLVFDVKHGNISKRVSGVPLSLAIDPVTGYVYMGDSSGFVSLLDDWNGTNGGGAAVNFDFQHGYLDFQRGSNKKFSAVEFYLNTNGLNLTPTIYYDNGTSSEALAAISTTSLQRVVRPLESSNSRKAQNISWRVNGSLTAVNTSGTPQIQINSVKFYYDIYTGRARTGQT